MAIPQPPSPPDDLPAGRPVPAGSGQKPAQPIPVNDQKTGKNRPVPVAAGKSRSAPIPVKKTRPAKQAGPAVQIIQDRDELDEKEGDLHDDIQVALKKTPPWVISAVVHAGIVVALGLITFLPEMLPVKPIILTTELEEKEEDKWAEEIGEQTEYDNQNPDPDRTDSEEAISDSDLPEVDDPLATPPEETSLAEEALTSTIEAKPTTDIGKALDGRERGKKNAMLAAYGGNRTTEEAVMAALRWLQRNQMKSGVWKLTEPYTEEGLIENQYAATAMALLAYQGAGFTHQKQKVTKKDIEKERDPNEFLTTVQRGWSALLKLQAKDGHFFDKSVSSSQYLYTHAQCTIALCELYGMTKDPKLKEPAERAIAYCVAIQEPTKEHHVNFGGGWRYKPGIESDLSVTGWFVMALQSAKMAQLKVPQKTLENINHFLDHTAVKDDNGGHRYRYPRHGFSLAMTAEGLLCRQYLGWKRNRPELLEACDYLLDNPVNYSRKNRNVYYWYYATQVTHHMGGRIWNDWNRIMREEIPKHQEQEKLKSGELNPERGSWSPKGHEADFGDVAGRLYITCLSTYMLEVYYRHLPIYKHKISR